MTAVAFRDIGLWRCRMPQEILSLNKFVSGRHWASKNKHWLHTRDIWMPLLRSDEGLGVPVPHGFKKRTVRIERWVRSGQRLFDDENMAGGSVKCICDALVRLGWLKDDSPQWRELELLQRKYADLSVEEAAAWSDFRIASAVEVRDG